MSERRVLIVEDEAEVLQAWQEALEAEGYVAIGFSSAVEALSRVPHVAPDVILLDMTLPGMDGFEFLARLRAMSPGSTVPVLIVSALGEALLQSIDAQGTMTLGLAGILMKPVWPTTLLRHVREIIGPPHASTTSLER